jgi:ubiquinone biosynthesis protein
MPHDVLTPAGNRVTPAPAPQPTPAPAPQPASSPAPQPASSPAPQPMPASAQPDPQVRIPPRRAVAGGPGRAGAPFRGLVPRFLAVHRHVAGLMAGALVARAGALPPERRRRAGGLFLRAMAAVVRPWIRSDLRGQPFPVHLRRRLELLGTTYIKLGQIMAIRQDLLPPAICRELSHLFDEIPPIPFAEVRRLLAVRLGRPPDLLFESIEATPLGSASIAQVHRARTAAGDDVVIKVMKPGIRTAVLADLRLLRGLGWILQKLLRRYQPLRIIDEFSAYTLKELDFSEEADNAETFSANFRDMPEVQFPAIHRDLSCEAVLTMQYLDGFKPNAPAAAALAPADRARLIDLGAAAIIRMLYRDGFFHADLHPANLLVLGGSGEAPLRIGFIDLGMAGRFETRTRRRMLYYYHALVTGDADGAATFLAEMAEVGSGGDPAAFHRAVVDLSRRFLTRSERGEISIAQLILESIGLGARYGVYFPVEMTLMVKALVTFEGVGRSLDPGLDVAALSRRHVTQVLRSEFTPYTMARELLRQAPELMDLAVRLPQLLSDGGRFLEHTFHQRPRTDPAAGLRTAVLAGACIVGGAIALTGGAPAGLWASLFAAGTVLALLRR